jgi:hypothetical protein
VFFEFQSFLIDPLNLFLHIANGVQIACREVDTRLRAALPESRCHHTPYFHRGMQQIEYFHATFYLPCDRFHTAGHLPGL